MRRVAAVAAIITALLVQLSVVNRLGLPGAAPELLLVVVLVLALLEGPVAGMSYGFVAGLLGDALSLHTLGRLALVWTVSGFLAGLLADPGGRAGERSPLIPTAVVGALSAASTAGYGALEVLVGAARDSTVHMLVRALAVGVYGAVLAPVVYLALRALLRRLEPART